MPLPVPPGDELPPLPDDATLLFDKELSSLFSQMTMWTDYAGTLLALAEVDEKYASDDLDLARASAIVSGRDKTATVAKARAVDDPAVVVALRRHSDAYAVRKITESVFKKAERRAAFLSREITRRTSKSDFVDRQQRWQP